MCRPKTSEVIFLELWAAIEPLKTESICTLLSDMEPPLSLRASWSLLALTLNSAALWKKVIRNGAEVCLCPKGTKWHMPVQICWNLWERRDSNFYESTGYRNPSHYRIQSCGGRFHLNSNDAACSMFTVKTGS